MFEVEDQAQLSPARPGTLLESRVLLATTRGTHSSRDEYLISFSKYLVRRKFGDHEGAARVYSECLRFAKKSSASK